MNGGTFTPGVEKVRPGIYFRFTSAARERMLMGERGTVALPLDIGWGPVKEFVEISKQDDIVKKLGLEPSDSSLLLLREAMKRSKTVKVYRVGEGKKAEADVGTELDNEVTAIAKYGGTKGNNITIRVSENVVDSDKFDVTTLFSKKAVDRQVVSDGTELEDNDWVEFDVKGSGTLEYVSAANLTGGTDEEPTNLDYTDFLKDAELEFYDVIGLPVDGEDEDDLKAMFVSFVKRMRDEQGVKIVGVVANLDGDHEGIINVVNGATLPEKQLTEAETVAWVAGASSGATVNQSLTFVEYEGAIGVKPEFDNDEIIERIGKGEFMLTYDPRDKVVSVEKDINSLTTFTTEKNKKFSNNKLIRIIDAINNDLTREMKRTIKELKNSGRDIPVNDDGKQIVETLVASYMMELEDGGAIQNFDSAEDVQIETNDDNDGFFINIGIEDVGSAEKFYFGVEVS